MKKRSTLILLIVLVALIGGYFAFLYKWNGPDNEFQIKDPNAVAKVEIEEVAKNESRSKLLLERKAIGQWTVNGKYEASMPQVNDFLKTLCDIRVKEPIGDRAQASSLSLLKRNHTRVKIWDQNGGLLKDYLVGPTDNTQTANIFKMEFSDKCYMVSKPALDGYVSIYYNTVEENWRDKALWNLKPEDVQMVAATYLNDTASNSFQIAQQTNGWILNGSEVANAPRLNAYLELFKGKVSAESFADAMYPEMQDSLLKRKPEVEFSIQTAKENIVLKLFSRPESASNFFALVDGRKELLTVQQFVIGPFLKTKGYFVQ